MTDTIDCLVCGVSFSPGSPRQKFCSEACKQRNKRGGASLGLARAAKESVEETRKVLYWQDAKRLEKTQEKADAFVADLKKRGVRVLGDDDRLELISSGVDEIDKMTGGFPRELITEIFGMKGVGKTTLMSKLVRGLGDVKVLYVDSENTMKEKLPGLDVVSQSAMEEAVETVEKAVKAGSYDLIVVDSVASLLPRQEEEGGFAEANMPIKAKQMGKWMRLLPPLLPGSRTAVVFINQERDFVGLYGPLKITPGGHALEYAASLRLKLKTTKADRIKKGEEFVGHWVTVEVEKSRICRPHQTTKFKLMYPGGKDVSVQNQG